MIIRIKIYTNNNTADGAELTNMGTIKAYLYENAVDLPKILLDH